MIPALKPKAAVDAMQSSYSGILNDGMTDIRRWRAATLLIPMKKIGEMERKSS